MLKHLRGIAKASHVAACEAAGIKSPRAFNAAGLDDEAKVDALEQLANIDRFVCFLIGSGVGGVGAAVVGCFCECIDWWMVIADAACR